MPCHELRITGLANSHHSMQQPMWILQYAAIKIEFLFFFWLFCAFLLFWSKADFILKIVNFKFQIGPVDWDLTNWCSVNYAI